MPCVNDPQVVASYLGSDAKVIERSGEVGAARSAP